MRARVARLGTCWPLTGSTPPPAGPLPVGGGRVAKGAQFLQGCPKSSRSPWFSVAVSTPPLDWSTRGAGCSCS